MNVFQHGMTEEQSVMDAFPSVDKGPYNVVSIPGVHGYAMVCNSEGVNALTFRSMPTPAIASIAVCSAVCARFNSMWNEKNK